MKKFVEEMVNNFKKISGDILCIGVTEDKFLNVIEKNDNIKSCNLMSLDSGSGFGKGSFFSKKINIKRIKKKFKKKRIDYTICNIECLEKYVRRFYKDSVYITKNSIYFYGKKDYDFKEISTKYKRYGLDVKVFEFDDYFLIEIVCSNKKYNPFKSNFYYIADTFIYVIDLISDVIIG